MTAKSIRSIGVALGAIALACTFPAGKPNDTGGRNSEPVAVAVDSPERLPNSTDLRKAGALPEPNERFVTFLVDRKVGWAAKGLRIWKTENFGESWTLVYVFPDDRSEPGREIDGIVFRNQLQGWATLGNRIFGTSDGGETWTEAGDLGLGFDGTIGPIALTGSAILLGAGETLNPSKPVGRPIFAFGKSIFRFDVNSKAWARTDLSRKGTGAISRIDVVDDARAIAIGEEVDDVFFTSDGGRTWKRSRLRESCRERESFPKQDNKPVAVGSYSDGSVWIAFDDGRVLKSGDFGKTVCLLLKPEEVWEKDQGPAYFEHMCFVSARIGVARKANGQLFRTENAGKLWRRIDSELRFDDLQRIDGACYALADGIYEVSTPN